MQHDYTALIGLLLGVLYFCGITFQSLNVGIRQLFSYPDITNLDTRGTIVYGFYTIGTWIVATLFFVSSCAVTYALLAKGVLDAGSAFPVVVILALLIALFYGVIMISNARAFQRLYSKTFPKVAPTGT